MLKESFVLLDRVSSRKEQSIWEQSISSWDEFIEAKKIKGFSNLVKEKHDKKLNEAKKKLLEDDYKYFAQTLPSGEHWRLYPQYKNEAVFLDIETTGYYGDITIIGLFDGFETKTMVKGFNLDKQLLLNELAKYKLLVTFNGASFDLPMIKKYFNIPFNIPHMDLRFLCQKIGLTGGLKSIEKQLNIHRAKEVEDMHGADAVYLWQMWKATGDKDYLDKLVKYNEEDIINLKQIAEFGVKELWKKIKNPIIV